MGPSGFAAVGIGAAIGAWLRWWLGVVLNPLTAMLPVGTLTANLVGGYLIGIAVGFFAQHADLPVEIRLLVVTGFLGGLTTFSTFSAEAIDLMSRQQFGWAVIHIGSHLVGSLLMTVLGLYSVHLVSQHL